MFADRAKIIIKSGKAETDMCPSVVKICAERWSGRWRWRKRRRCHFLSRRGNQYACRLSAQTKIRSRTGRRRWQEKLPWKNGADLILKVPEGTIIRDAASGKVIADMSGKISVLSFCMAAVEDLAISTLQLPPCRLQNMRSRDRKPSRLKFSWNLK